MPTGSISTAGCHLPKPRALTGRTLRQSAGDAEDRAEVTLALSAKNIERRELLQDLTATEKVVGEIAIDINIDSSGRSIEALMRSLEGSAAVVAGWRRDL